MNWYKKAQSNDLPFNIYKIEGGNRDTKITKSGVPVVIWAVNRKEARVLAFIKYPQLKTYVDGCLSRNQECDIDLRIDEEKKKETEKYVEVRGDIKTKQEQMSWWNK